MKNLRQKMDIQRRILESLSVHFCDRSIFYLELTMGGKNFPRVNSKT